MQRRHLPVLIDGFARAAARVPGARLELVGDDRTWPAQAVRELADATGLGDRIHIRSYVDDATLADLYARAAVFAFLSSYEGFGLTPLEAANAGVPPVVLDTPVAREVLGDGAAYVTPDAAVLAPVLERLLTSPAAHADLVARARRQVASYSWDRTARTTFDLLLEAGRA
jgi:glycosyltransferase involved in cell wall biosynthesis